MPLLTDSLTDSLFDSLFDSLTDSLSDSFSDYLINLLVNFLVDFLVDTLLIISIGFSYCIFMIFLDSNFLHKDIFQVFFLSIVNSVLVDLQVLITCSNKSFLTNILSG